MRSGALLALALTVVPCACKGGGQSGQWTVVAPDELSTSQRQQLVRAQGARDALQQALGGKLQAALSEGTPVEAIAVCKQVAPDIAADVSAAQGLAIGRTSQRLRNPSSTPPAWAAEHVAGVAQDPACFAGPDGELGVLLPIRTLPLCLTCHGPAAALDQDVAQALRAAYPADRALGYRQGELRGWFWVEVDS